MNMVRLFKNVFCEVIYSTRYWSVFVVSVILSFLNFQKTK